MDWLNRLLVFLTVILPIVSVLDGVSSRFWKFDPARLQQLSQAAIAKHGDNVEQVMRTLVTSLQKEYPTVHLNDFDTTSWVFNVAGGATGQMLILHSSITEYLILFGTASGTEGHSGVHLAQDYFTILSGQQTAEFLGELKPRTYLPGDQHWHPRLTSAHYKMENGSWALELAQGVIPSMLPFGFAQMPQSLDIDSMIRTVYYTGRSTVLNLLMGKL